MSNHSPYRAAKAVQTIFRGALFATAVLVAGAQEAMAGSVMDVLQQQPAFSRFVHLVQSSGLAGELENGGTFTIFAPSNAAFDTLPPDLLQALTAEGDADLVRETVQNLVVPARWSPQDLAQKRLRLQAVNGRSIFVDGTQGRLTANDAEILDVDATPSNGVIYEIDSLEPAER